MLVALRQLIVRQPESPGLLALAAHMVQSLDPIEVGWAFAESMQQDRTADLAEEIALAEAGGTDVIDSLVSGPAQVLAPMGTTAWIEHARASGRSVVVVTPLGTRLPSMLWKSYLERNGYSGDDDAVELVDLDAFDDVIGPEGLLPVDSWRADCPDVAEIARL